MRNTFLFVLILTIAACSSEDSTPTVPLTGVISGTVTNTETSLAIPGVRIVVFDANTNSPTGLPVFTDNNGNYSFELSPGTYQLKLGKQGYEEIPPRGFNGIPLNVTGGQTTSYSISMFESGLLDVGLLSGVVTLSGIPAAGVLVVADDGTEGYSSVSAADGSFVIYNLPPTTYFVRAWQTTFNSTDSTVVMGAGKTVSDVNLVLSSIPGGSVSGQITFLATTNAEVDIALTNPFTKETIPGLNTLTVNRSYTLNGVPNGTYLARASYANDGIVMDPDWIIKNGEPWVTVSGNVVTRDFSVTDAVELISPTNPPASTQPILVNSVPVLSWTAYPSASHYVVEVSNARGNVIWGGFEENWTNRKVLVPSSQTSIIFNADSSATESLSAGKIYHWKVYASKDSNQDPLGWILISQSEEQMGLITISP